MSHARRWQCNMEICVGQIWKVIVVPSIVRYPLIVMQEYMFYVAFLMICQLIYPGNWFKPDHFQSATCVAGLFEKDHVKRLYLFFADLSLLRKPVMEPICTSYYNDLDWSIMFIRVLIWRSEGECSFSLKLRVISGSQFLQCTSPCRWYVWPKYHDSIQ